jgi:type VI secretion system lysozyme-like protein
MNNIILLSIIDRLTNDNPNSLNNIKYIDRLKTGVKRDLEDLLNAKRPIILGLKVNDYPMAKNSILFYGLSDFSTQKTEDIVLNIKETIRTFEPRLENVSVEVINLESSNLSRYLIRANLKIEPHPIPISFDVDVDKYSSSYVLTNRE